MVSQILKFIALFVLLTLNISSASEMINGAVLLSHIQFTQAGQQVITKQQVFKLTINQLVQMVESDRLQKEQFILVPLIWLLNLKN